jgi:carboxymethylenebutenolidase
VFYGFPPPHEELKGLQARVLAHYAENDPRITPSVPALADAMRAGAKHFEHHIYPGSGHAFFNDTRPSYRVTSARHAWARTLAFLAHVLHEAHV